MAKVAIAPVFVLFLNVRGFLKEIIKLKGTNLLPSSHKFQEAKKAKQGKDHVSQEFQYIRATIQKYSVMYFRKVVSQLLPVHFNHNIKRMICDGDHYYLTYRIAKPTRHIRTYLLFYFCISRGLRVMSHIYQEIFEIKKVPE